jgi:UPF0755 protein
MAKKRSRKLLPIWILALLVVVAGLWFNNGIRAVSSAKAKKEYVRYEEPRRLSVVLKDLEKRGFIRNATAARILAILQSRPNIVSPGAYSLSPSMSASTILKELKTPVKLILRFPETNWANRTAHLLQNYSILDADEYMRLVRNPQAFDGTVSFPLPKDSLEGYLYPKHYEVTPLMGAKAVIDAQLKEFEKEVWNGAERPKDLQRTLTLASLVQLESGADNDRAMIAGVIENRLKKNMPLQIDAALLYGIQKWRRLTFKDYKEIDSPYNVYKFKGLPPGPICSPDEKDVLAALHPAKHNYLYYVAMPDGTSIYAETYPQHLKNIAKRKAALAQLKGVKK